MISGFNTDIEFEGVVYHVQTEDKGLERPIILSLVYIGGTILAAKRSPYDDLVKKGFDEKALEERLNRQHRLICAAIKAGRIEDLKRMSAGEPAIATNGGGVMPEPIAKPFDPFEARDNGIPIPMPDVEADVFADPLIEIEELFIDAVEVVEEPTEVPESAVAVVSDLAGRERAQTERLTIEMVGDQKFKGGERRSVTLMICRGAERRVVGNAQIMVKVLGSAFRPLIFHASTDANGIARLNVQFPRFNTGRAAFLVRAMSEGEEAEIRRPIVHG
ncbi:MAG: hypothetical protein IPM21_02765 [Acidobacteria bacterium]|nr:hypothetical protein [Acidobacteriota bacterium]